MRVELILDIRAHNGLSLKAPFEVRANGKRTLPPLRTRAEVLERLVGLGIHPSEAGRRLEGLTDSAPYVEFEWDSGSGAAARD